MVSKKFFSSVIILMLAQFVFAQPSRKIARMYELINESDNNHSINDMKSLRLAKEASSLAQSYGSDANKATTDVILANALASLGMYKESFVYLERSLSSSYAKKDVQHQLLVKLVKADIYQKLNLNDQSLIELRQIFTIAKRDTTGTNISALEYEIIKRIGENLITTGKLDSASVYINTAERQLKRLSHSYPAFTAIDIPHLYLLKSKLLLDKKEIDSSYYYLEMGFHKLNKNPSVSLDTYYVQYGNFYNQLSNTQKALKYYLLSLSQMEKYKITDPDRKSSILQKIATLYGKLGKMEEMAIFNKKYDVESNKTIGKNRESIQKAVNEILDEKKDEIEKLDDEKNGWIFIALVIIIVTFGLFYVGYKGYKRRMKISEIQLEAKDRLISENYIESSEMRQKINEAFEEVIQLAKENHPNFYKRFSEVYPDFQIKLLLLDQSLKNSELVLLAYVFLNFKTKEIAEYTFKSSRTVQNRKHMLRKKLLVPAEDDLYIWIQNAVR